MCFAAFLLVSLIILVSEIVVCNTAKDGRSAPAHAPRAFRARTMCWTTPVQQAARKSARICGRARIRHLVWMGIDGFSRSATWCSVEDENCSDLRPRAIYEHLLSAGSYWERVACSARGECALWAMLRCCLLLACSKVTKAPAGQRLHGFSAGWHTRCWHRSANQSPRSIFIDAW